MRSPKHLIFIKADHFEPDSSSQVTDWVRNFASIAKRHHDSDGCMPRHTWFYWGKNRDELEILRDACAQGCGEVEIHIHHANDTAENLEADIKHRLDVYASCGLRQRQTRIPFAFTHGHWSLDNAGGRQLCGVNNELQVLARTGCFADFTFPSNKRNQPRKINSIYYATDDPEQPKSYDTGVDVEVGKQASGDLMIFEGPGKMSGCSMLGRIPFAQKLLERLCVYTDISRTAVPTPIRIRNWVGQNIHVKGRPEWVFVKCHMHGARHKDYPHFFGPIAHQMYTFFEQKYNDGVEWQLHYMTAREAYNTVKAAEAGKSGNPHLYRDYLITRYTSPVITNGINT